MLLRSTGTLLAGLEAELADHVTVLERRQGDLSDLQRLSDPAARAALERLLARERKGSRRLVRWGIVLGVVFSIIT